MGSLKKNYFFNTGYQILTLLSPLVTTPYVSRVLGADGVGFSSYTASIVSYFTLFAVMGTVAYGQREISYVQDDRHERSCIFWDLIFFRLITVIIISIIYCVFCYVNITNNVWLIYFLNIINVFFDITWFYTGMEDFRRIVTKNIALKLLNIVYIFVVIKKASDVGLYIFGICFMTLLGSISLWFNLPQYIDKPNWKELNPLKHIAPVWALFIPTIAIQIYSVLDKTMIGIITNDAFQNGYYEQALKISKMLLTVVTSISAVLAPRVGFYYNHDREKMQYYLYKAYRFVWFIGIPLCLGLIAISSNVIPWFLGEGYDVVISLLGISSFLILAIGINSVTGNVYLVPAKKQNIYTVSVIIGAVVNFILNFILIPVIGAFGAALSSVIAETTIAVFQLFFVRNDISIKHICLMSSKYLIAGFIMFLVVLYLSVGLSPSIMHSITLMCAGSVIYSLVLLVLKEAFVYDILSVIKKKIFSK